MAIRVESGAEPIPGYRLIDRLGGGGFGEVWKAEAPGGLLKAIKFVYGDLQAEDEDGVRRAEQELKALRRVQTVRHPYLLSLERYDIIDNRLLIVMELADRNLWDRFKECRSQGLPGLPREELLRYMDECAEVLDLMNDEYQLQHLDIKPQNLFLVHNHVKVADFGLVKDMEGKSATVTGGVTPVYAAPETFDGMVSCYCDQYSLGIVYQELLCGQRPFSGTNVQQLIMQHLTGTPNLSPLPPADREAIGRSLAKKPEDRFPNITEMVRALRTSSTEVVAARPAQVIVAAPAAGSDTGRDSRLEGETVNRPAPAPPRAPLAQRPNAIAPSRPETGMSPPAPKPPSPPRPAAPPASPGGPLAKPGGMRERVRPPASEAVASQMPESERPREAPPEVTGKGLLFPAVVIGLGGVGQEILQAARECLVERYGSLQLLPNLKFLYVETDPDVAQEAPQWSALAPWNPQDVLLTRLNRPMHYQKPREGRVPVDTWLDFRMLYRLPRNPVTTGMRALGRLALMDNYRIIAGRLQSDLEECLSPEALTTADRNTRLGIRTNRARVYIVTSLGGGTGGGMFIDLAYLVRAQLKKMGYARPDVVGLFLLPPVDRDPGKLLAMGNAFAALTELNHFSAPNVTYTTRFDLRESAVMDPDPPFSRTILLPLTEEGRRTRGNKVSFMAGEYLFRDLVTPLGRAIEASRTAPPSKHLSGQIFGMCRFSWPRRTLLQRAARQLCGRLVQRWIARETPALQAAVQSWVLDQWSRQELAPESLIEQLQQACAQALGQAPEDVFTNVITPFLPRGRRVPEVNPQAVLEALDRLEQLVGRPEEMAGPRRAPALGEALDKAADGLTKASAKKITQLAECLIEQPDYRLAGAEEAIRQIESAIAQALEHHDPLSKELAARAAEAYSQLHSLLGQIQANPGKRTAHLVPDLIEVLRLYPKWRYQSLVLRRLIAIYGSLKGQLTDETREVGFCRYRLNDMQQTFDSATGTGKSSSSHGPGQYLLPANSRNVEDACAQLLQGVTAEDLKDLDRFMQGMVQQQFTGLLQVCLSKSNLLKNLETAMVQQAESFLGNRLGGGDVIEMFLNKFSPQQEAVQALADAFDKASPELAGLSRHADPEVDILALPEGPKREYLADLARRTLSEARLTLADSTDDIVFYREQSFLPLADLEQSGNLGQEAYRQMVGSENFTPHSRMDITDWQEIEAD